jgi:tetratricopeptide (TPR) repeat protein
LVVFTSDTYAVSQPIKDAVLRVKGHITETEYTRICENLTKAFWAMDNASPSISIVDATLHAVARSGSVNLSPYQDLVRPSIVHRLAKESYNRKEWPLALEYAKRAEEMGVSPSEIRAIKFKSLVQLEQWGNSMSVLQEINRNGDRQALYLKGFMLRKQRKYAEAIPAFEDAIASGDKGIPVYRDLADCLWRCHHYQEAMENIELAIRRRSDNRPYRE